MNSLLRKCSLAVLGIASVSLLALWGHARYQIAACRSELQFTRSIVERFERARAAEGEFEAGLVGPRHFDWRKSPDLRIAEAYAIAADALSTTNGYYCYQAILEGEPASITSEGVLALSTNVVWRFHFHNTNGSPPAPTEQDDICVEVRAKRPPRVLTYWDKLMRERR